MEPGQGDIRHRSLLHHSRAGKFGYHFSAHLGQNQVTTLSDHYLAIRSATDYTPTLTKPAWMLTLWLVISLGNTRCNLLILREHPTLNQ